MTTSEAMKDIEPHNFHSYHVGMQNDKVTLVGSLTKFYKQNALLLYYPESMFLDICPMFKNFCSHKSLYMKIYNSYIHNCQNLEKKKDIFPWVDEYKNCDTSRQWKIIQN